MKITLPVAIGIAIFLAPPVLCQDRWAEEAGEAAAEGARKAAGDTSVRYAKQGSWEVRKDTNECELFSPGFSLLDRKGDDSLRIVFNAKSPMPLKTGDTVPLRLDFYRASEREIHETPEQNFVIIDLGGVSFVGNIPVSMLDDFSSYESGGLVFGEATLIKGFNLTGSSPIIASFRRCLSEIGI